MNNVIKPGKSIDKILLFLRMAEVDRAVVYSLMTKLWSMLGGLVTIVLMTKFLTPLVQGYYYTFFGLLALQSFADLGFSLVIVQFASHEWANLHLDKAKRISGDLKSLSRLVSLGRLGFKWYGIASGLFVVCVGYGGLWFLSGSQSSGIYWQTPWLILVFLSGIQIWCLPILAILEGCNQIANIYLYRLVQGVLYSIALWIAFIFKAELWSPCVSYGITVLCTLAFIFIAYRKFIEPFFVSPRHGVIHWHEEVWPMQWRLGLSGLVNYFAFSLYTPVMFHYHGAVVAGQMGMTWQIVQALQGIASSWLYTKVPRFGILIKQRAYETLDHLWKRVSFISVSVSFINFAALWLLLFVLYQLDLALTKRMLSPLPTALFFLASIIMQIIQCQVAYLRAHKKEPVMLVGVSASILIGLLVWILGKTFGPSGAGAAYLGVVIILIVSVTQIWVRCRKEWHQA